MIGDIFTLVLLNPMINFLVLLNNVLFGSFGLAIIAFTVIVRVVTFPLTLRQLHASRAMQELAPKIQEISKKHSDPKRRQEETMRLYREGGVNPLGCLGPMILQIPILFALFWAVQRTLPESPEALEKLSNHLYNWSYLQQAVPLETHFLGLDLRSPNIVLVFLVALTTWAQTKTTVTVVTDERARAQQQMMLYMMPIMFGFFALGFPSGVSLYWVINALVGIGFNILTYGFPMLHIEPVFKRKVTARPAPSDGATPEPAAARALQATTRTGGRRKGASQAPDPSPAPSPTPGANSAPELRTANGLGRSKRQNRRRRP